MKENVISVGRVVVLIAGVLAGIWFATTLPTAAARFVWQRYHAAPLAVALDRSDADLAMYIGSYYFNGVMGGGEYNPELAQKAFAKAVSIQPNILWGHYDLARIYFIKSDFARALDEINRELDANPANLRSLYIRGLIYGYRNLPGDLASAEADLRRFTAWAPTEWGGYNDLAWVLSREGKNKEAGTLITSAFKQVPHGTQNPWLLNALGVAELALGENQKAASAFGKAKMFAAPLGVADWRRAYPGDDPLQDASGLAAFRAAIDENLSRVTNVDNQ